MELDFAFLADAAEVTGGKLYVLGGAFDTIWIKEPPVTVPHMTLAMRFLFSPAEAGRQHSLEIIILDEDGKKLVNLQSNLNVERSQGLTMGIKQPVPIALNFFNIRFEKSGVYSVEILFNGSSLKSIPLRLMRQTAAAAA
ncbi:MAG: hypothetical protein HY547_02195 [Elusimicrobia bacterium]|nr:hypothetical protein [Elusimicrobiota bacterium]